MIVIVVVYFTDDYETLSGVRQADVGVESLCSANDSMLLTRSCASDATLETFSCSSTRAMKGRESSSANSSCVTVVVVVVVVVVDSDFAVSFVVSVADNDAVFVVSKDVVKVGVRPGNGGFRCGGLLVGEEEEEEEANVGKCS